MPALTLNRLKDVLIQSYKLGFHGCYDMQTSLIDKLVEELIQLPVDNQFSVNDGWKIFTLKELTNLRQGTIIDHSVRGIGYIQNNKTMILRKTCAVFKTTGVCQFHSDTSPPWNELMRIVER